MIIFGVGTFYLISNLPGHYVSKSVLLITNEENENNFAKETFVTHLQTRDILETVITNLSLIISYDELLSYIQVKRVDKTELIEITVSTSSSRDSKRIIDELIKTFDANLEKFYPGEELKLIETPVESVLKTFVNLEFYTYLGLGVGFLIGVLLISLFATIDPNIKNHEDVKKYLNIKSLGIVPDNALDDEVNLNNNKTKKTNKKSRENIKIINSPYSLVSESYRMIRTNLDFLDLKVVNFTSTAAGEGKSETISNIAAAFAITGKKVLVMDCDLRKPMMHKIFNVNRTQGLTDIVVYNRLNEVKKFIQTYKVDQTDYTVNILSAGSKIYNPAELLNSKRFESLLEQLRDEYDLILIDCPPISLMTDAVLVSKYTNGTAFVIEYNRMNHATINNSLDQLRDVNAHILGSILTKVNIRKEKKLYGNKYEYYSNYI